MGRRTGRPRGRPKGRRNSRPSPRAFYTVYNRRTDFPVMIGGTAKECAAAMGITVGSFYTIYTKIQKGNRDSGQRWEIFHDDPGDMEVE